MIRVATFNAANLFSRPDFLKGGGRPSDRRVGMVEFQDKTEQRLARRISEATLTLIERQLTAQVVLDADADFIALQEIDDLAALTLFRDDFVHPSLVPRMARALQVILPAVHREADQLFGLAASPARDEWLAKAMDAHRKTVSERLFYNQAEVIEGNDRRGIDLGFLSRLAPTAVVSHAHVTFDDVGLWSGEVAAALVSDWRQRGEQGPMPDGRTRVFRRDCVMVELEVDGSPLTIFNCHFKSNASGGRDKAYPLREAEVRVLVSILRRRFPNPADGNWIICGDLNDYVDVDGMPAMFNLKTGLAYRSALKPLLAPQPEGLGAFDVNQWIADPTDRWTSYFPLEDIYSQLDHILISPALFAANVDRPTNERQPRVLRRGLPWSVERAPPRYPGVGLHDPKASDHAAIAIDLEIP
ncbi:Endonuclease/exonuclease/phosphatase [Rhabdaerophilaceae bacterium]